MILHYALTFALACFALALLMNLWRLYTADNIVDRILTVDTMAVNTTALIILHSAHSSAIYSFEAAILFAMTGFVATVAYCKYLLRGSIIE
jgi:multicomponent K+:H+ antiporter subunit F